MILNVMQELHKLSTASLKTLKEIYIIKKKVHKSMIISTTKLALKGDMSTIKFLKGMDLVRGIYGM